MTTRRSFLKFLGSLSVTAAVAKPAAAYAPLPEPERGPDVRVPEEEERYSQPITCPHCFDIVWSKGHMCEGYRQWLDENK